MQYQKRQKKMGYLKELLDARLRLNFTLLILGDEIFAVGKIDTYELMRDSGCWWVKGVFENYYLENRLPDGVKIFSTQANNGNNNHRYAQLQATEVAGFWELINDIVWTSGFDRLPSPEIELFRSL